MFAKLVPATASWVAEVVMVTGVQHFDVAVARRSVSLAAGRLLAARRLLVTAAINGDLVDEDARCAVAAVERV